MYNTAKELYLQGASLRQIEKETGINRKTLSRMLYRDGIDVKPRSKGTTGIRKYNLNEDVFEVIDTQEKAYWLGFLYADGYVDRNKLELGLAEVDREHLEKFRQFLDTDAPIAERLIDGKYKACRVNICSSKIVTDLARHGCTQAKSLTLTFPILREDLLPHFMRGYFDGDGTLYMRSDGQICWDLLGTKEFLEGYQAALMNAAGLNATQIRISKSHGKAHDVRYSGNRVGQRIIDFLYQDATIYLERKAKLLPSRDKAAEVSGL